MRWFRRSKGRHALGAAVTAIPSGPVAATWTPQPWDAPAAGAPARSVLPAPVLPAAMVPAPVPPASVPAASVPAASVPAAATTHPVVPPPVGTVLTVPTSPPSQAAAAPDLPREPPVAVRAQLPEVAETASRDELFDSIAALIASGEAWSQAPVATLAGPVQAAPVYAVPVQAVPVQAAPVQAAPVQAVPVQAVPVYAVPLQAAPRPSPAPEPHGTRVSIGFRDGTTAVLAQDSEQAAALEELAALLSLRD